MKKLSKMFILISLLPTLGCGVVDFKKIEPGVEKNPIKGSKVLETTLDFKKEDEAFSSRERFFPHFETGNKRLSVSSSPEIRREDVKPQRESLKDASTLYTRETFREFKDPEIRKEFENPSEIKTSFEFTEDEVERNFSRSYEEDQSLETESEFLRKEAKELPRSKDLEMDKNLHVEMDFVNEERRPSSRRYWEGSRNLHTHLSAKADRLDVDYSLFKVTDIFVKEREEKAIDLLVVSDSIASMSRRTYENMERKLKHLFSTRLKNVDFRVAIMDTYKEKGEGHLIYFSNGETFLTKDTPRYEEEFFLSFESPDCTFCMPPHEKSFEALSRTIRKNRIFREDAELHVLFITDDDDNSYGIDELLSDFKSYTPNSEVKFHGIIIPKFDDRCLLERTEWVNERGRAKKGRRIQDLIEKTNGEVHSICEGSYKDLFKGMEGSKSLKPQASQFSLSQKPIVETLKVSFDPEEEESDWILQEGTLIFKKPIRARTKITVQYETYESKN